MIPFAPGFFSGPRIFNQDVLLLLQGEGPNNSTTIIDSSYYNRTVTGDSASVINSTTRSKFGGGSVYLPANSNVRVTPDSNFNFSEWQLDMWVWTTGHSPSPIDDMRFMAAINPGVGIISPSSSVWAGNPGTPGTQHLGFARDVVIGNIVQAAWDGFTNDTWSLYTFAYNGSRVRAWINGVPFVDGAWNGVGYPWNYFTIGSPVSFCLGIKTAVWIDSLRLTKKVYWTDYTTYSVPTEPFTPYQ